MRSCTDKLVPPACHAVSTNPTVAFPIAAERRVPKRWQSLYCQFRVIGLGIPRMTSWKSIEGWMRFSNLDQMENVRAAFTLGYRFSGNHDDAWTRRFDRFKNDERRAAFGGAQILKVAVPRLITALKIDPDDLVFVSALSSGEETAQPGRTIPKITRICADLCGARFQLDALRKNAHRKLHSLGTAARRSAELDKAEYRARRVQRKHVAVFDDFITRGDTLSTIATAIRERNPRARVFGIALAKTERLSYSPSANNDHVPREWFELWKEGVARADRLAQRARR